MRNIRVTFLCTTAEKGVLEALSRKLGRTPSNTLRWLISNAAHEIGIPHIPELPKQDAIGAEEQDPALTVMGRPAIQRK